MLKFFELFLVLYSAYASDKIKTSIFVRQFHCSTHSNSASTVSCTKLAFRIVLQFRVLQFNVLQFHVLHFQRPLTKH